MLIHQQNNNIAKSNLFFLFLLNITALLPQLQMLAFGGKVYISNTFFAAVSLYLSVIYLLYLKKVSINRKLFRPIIYFILFLLFIMFFHLIFNGIGFGYSLTGYKDYYLGVVLLLLYLAFEDSVEEGFFVKLLLIIALPLLFLGLMQSAFNQPILHTKATNSSYQIFAWNYFGHVRAFSFFQSAADFGYYLCLTFICALHLSIFSRGLVKALYIVLAFIVCIALYLTLTRQVYLMALCSMFTYFSIIFLVNKKVKHFKLIIFLIPFVYAIVMTFAVAKFVENDYKNTTSGSLDNSESMAVRVIEWGAVASDLTSSSSKLIFGTGITQGRPIGRLDKKIIIDNTPLAVTYQIGLIGFIIFFILFLTVWRYIIDKAMAEKSTGLLAICSLFSTFGMSWVIGGNTYLNLLLACMAVVLTPRCKKYNEI